MLTWVILEQSVPHTRSGEHRGDSVRYESVELVIVPVLWMYVSVRHAEPVNAYPGNTALRNQRAWGLTDEDNAR